MKITPRPIAVSDETDQSRDISGVNKWGRSSRTVGFIMFILGWFTIPADVLLRRDFGQRWFTLVNFYAGMFLLLIFAVIQYVFTAIWDAILSFLERVLESIFGSTIIIASAPIGGLTDRLLDKSMMIILGVYGVVGAYHLFKIWWRNRTNTALHSFDDGTSRLEPLAGYLMGLLNALAVPFVYLCMRMVPKKQRTSMSSPQLISDRTSFTNTVVEPLLIFALAIWAHGITSFWLFITAGAVAIHASWKETAKLNKILDFRDSVMEAKVMMHLKNGTGVEQASTQSRIMQQTAEAIKDDPAVAPQMAGQYPDLMNIIEEMNKDKSHLAN